MQVMYQVQEDAPKPSSLASVSATLPITAQVPTAYRAYPQRVSQTNKIDNESYSNKLIYSPYLAPSHLIVEQKIDQNSISPIYMQNVARTKYAIISTVQKPQDNKSINVLI